MLSERDMEILETLMTKAIHKEHEREMGARNSATVARVFIPPPDDESPHLYSVTTRYLSKRARRDLIALMGEKAA